MTPDEISSSQYQKEVSANELFRAVSPSGTFGKRISTTSGLTFGYYGGILHVDGVQTSISNGTVSLTNSATNYVEATRSGTVSANTSGFTAGSIPLYTIVCSGGAQATPTDYRVIMEPHYVGSVLSKTWPSDANYTLTAAESRARKVLLSGATLTTTRDLFVPMYWDGFVRNGTGGGQSVRIRLSGSPSGSGVTIANGSGAFVFADDDDVIRASADA
jgi:hypothetical protein